MSADNTQPAKADADDVLYIVALPDPIRTHRIEGTVPAGGSVLDVLDYLGIAKSAERLHIAIGDQQIPRALWSHVRPKPEKLMIIKGVPAGGGGRGGKSPLRIAAQFAAIAATFAFPTGGTILGVDMTAKLFGGLTLGGALKGITAAPAHLVLDQAALPDAP